MSRGRAWLGGVLAVVAAAGLGAAGAFGAWPWSAGETYTHALEKYDDEHGEPNRYVDLADGAAQLSVGSPDGHRIVVQWRDPDGHGWTAPETVWTDRRNTVVDSTVRYGGGTVAIVESFTPDTGDEDDSHDVQVALVCRDLACVTARSPGVSTEAQVTPDGRVAYLGSTEQEVRLWTAEGGLRRVPWSGHPGFDLHEVSPSRPLLAPDGSLRVVAARPARGSCRFDLLVSEPRSADLVRAAGSSQPLRGRAPSDCASYLDTYGADWLAVHPSDHRAADFWFVRRGARWTTTTQDPSGLALVDVDRGCCDTAVAGFVHWNDVAFGSPDGRRIQVQTHLLGHERWSEPLLLDAAPPGSRCTWLEGHEVGDGIAVLMTCPAEPARDRSAGDAYAVVASPDLRHWQSAWVADVVAEPEITEDAVRVGPMTWTAEDGVERD